ncbi:hypothetical protein [Erysipelothrix rhusiopathiae]|uniref:hypothetical protein n=1 Tax=Erysipelothrix rhusiopathiae TaxID=1648 RepID=UPI002B2482FD|nr:hypothetical protein [Erysipelothrix rhusiopathiae]WRB92635.1 hypothetical protein LL063_06645 [Erysipelothrix rhusiopathiae]
MIFNFMEFCKSTNGIDGFFSIANIIITILALFVSIVALKHSSRANKINFESNAEWRKQLLSIASFPNDKFESLVKAAIALRACSRFELPEEPIKKQNNKKINDDNNDENTKPWNDWEPKEAVYEFQKEIDMIYKWVLYLDENKDENDGLITNNEIANRIRGLARLYLKISWEANHPQLIGKKNNGGNRINFSRRKRADAKYEWATCKHYKEFLDVHEELKLPEILCSDET